MYEIIPGLYLSSYHQINLDDPKHFMINCTKNLDMLNNNNMRIAVDDDCSQEALGGMLSALSEVVEVIDDRLKKGEAVIVYCLAGQQRSATVIAAYLMAKHTYTLDDAIAYIKDKKKDAFFWNVNFKWSLEQFAKSLEK